VLPEGFWYEGAWSYHFYALEPLVDLAEMASCGGIDLYSERNLHDLFSAPLQLAMPSGTLPAFNDSGELNIYTTDKLYEQAWARYSDPAFTAVLGKRTRGLNALLWGSAELPQADIAGVASKSFAQAGFTALRAPSGDHTVIVKYGPHGGGHGHYDKLGFVSFFNGSTMALDPGTQPYGAPTHDTWDKMTVAHNTVTVDETTQSEATGSLLWDDLGNDLYRAVRVNAGPAYPQVDLNRTLLLTSEYTLDIVEAEAKDGKDHKFDWTYHNLGQVETLTGDTEYTAFRKTNGYQHLTNTRASSRSDSWQVRFRATPATSAYGSVYGSTSDVHGTFETTQEQAYSGSFGGKATYDLRGTGYLLFTTPTLTGMPAGAPQKLSIMIYGDGSGSRLNLRMNDSTDERFVKEVGLVDWIGWKLIEVSDPEKWTHYLGNNDGVFDGPVRNVTLELWPSAQGPKTGALFVDDIALTFADTSATAADFELPLRNLRVWMLNEDGTTVVTGNGLGPDLTKPVPFVMARRSGQRTAFVSLLEPYRGEPGVVEFSRTADGDFVIRTAAFTDTFHLGPDGVTNFQRTP